MKKLFLAAGIAFAASVAMATTISITSGTADVIGAGAPGFLGAGQFSLFGTGVSFTGAGATTTGPCRFSFSCTGITPIGGGTAMSSEDQGLAGTVILDGITTNYLILPGQSAGAALDLTYILPAFSTVGSPATITLATPFTAFAGFQARGFNGDQPLFMNGEGIATIVLKFSGPASPGGPPSYKLQTAHYEFLVPEPGTAALILIGLVGLIVRNYWRTGRVILSPGTSFRART